MLVPSCQIVFGGALQCTPRAANNNNKKKNSIYATSRKSSWGFALDRHDNAEAIGWLPQYPLTPTLGYDHVCVFGTVITRIETRTHY